MTVCETCEEDVTCTCQPKRTPPTRKEDAGNKTPVPSPPESPLHTPVTRSGGAKKKPPLPTPKLRRKQATTRTSTVVTTSHTKYETPPDFMKDKTGFKEWKDDIIRWDRVTSVDPGERGDVILMHIPKSNPIKEFLIQEIGQDIVEHPDGVQLMIDTLEELYGEDEVLEGFTQFKKVIRKERPGNSTIKIPEALNEDNVTLYLISITVGTVFWTVKHRYNDFVELHDSLLEEGIEKDVLPPKKLIGNKEPSFIMKRRRELESYLQSVFHFLERNLPQSLADFLDLPHYDIHYILRGLASQIHDRENREDLEGEGDENENQCEWSPLELHAVSERLKSPCPPQDIESKRYDFTNVADFCCQLTTLHITGDDDNVGTSNIIPNQLEYDFLAFKCLKILHLSHVKMSPDRLTSLGILRQTIVELRVTDCDLSAVSGLLLCDVVHQGEDISSLSRTKSLAWPQLRQLDLSRNKLEAIDESLRLAPGLTSLDLSYNVITGLTNLTCLPHLSRLKMCHNKVKLVEEVHVKLGQVANIDLSHNKLKSLAGFAKLYSLVRLDVSSNKLRDVDEVFPVCTLPCLEFLDTSNNKVNDVVDYKLKVLERAGCRAGELLVDLSATTQADMDKVSVLMALRVAKEGKSPTALFGNLPSKLL